ncbi:MAG: hypothetical protein AABY04_04620 [Candidatus Micrarchaeota archaeon]
MSKPDGGGFFFIIFIGLIGIYLIWIWIVQPIIKWILDNSFNIFVAFSIVFAGGILLYIWKMWEENEMREKGFVKITNGEGNTLWISAEEYKKHLEKIQAAKLDHEKQIKEQEEIKIRERKEEEKRQKTLINRVLNHLRLKA